MFRSPLISLEDKTHLVKTDMEKPRRVSYAGLTTQRPRKDSRLRPTVAIIGGGAGGCCSAIELGLTGRFNILLLEKNRELMRGSSDITPGRLSLGFHYADKDTALYFLHVTVKFVKRYGNFRQELSREQSHPLRRGRYFIMKNSLVPAKTILEIYEAIKQEYAKIVREDPSCEVFGPPENIYRILEAHEFEKDVEIASIDMAIETAEELLDWPKMRKFLVDQIEQNENVFVQSNTNVVTITALSGKGFVIDGINTNHGGAVRIVADFVVNASWYNISKFNRMLGISSVCRNRCNRLKAIATVQIPKELANVPSMFFCMGPFCMFCNKGNGVGMITYAPETNIAVTTSSGEQETKFSRFCHGLADEKETLARGERILAGVTKYIPNMQLAKLTKVSIGIVQTFMDESTLDPGFKIGNLDFIHNPLKGEIAKRNYSGVEEPIPGYVINACIKLIYCFDNAHLV